jgi:hypothetical protein
VRTRNHNQNNLINKWYYIIHQGIKKEYYEDLIIFPYSQTVGGRNDILSKSQSFILITEIHCD